MSRHPRFKRIPGAGSIALTSRDREIIERVFQHRFLRSTHILSLQKGSRQQILRRLQRLFHHGYLDRPRAQIDYYRSGSQAMVYGIGHRGIKLLEREFAIPRRKVDWTAKNRTVTRYFLEHTLAVADVMVALELACRKHGGIHIVDHRASHEEPFKWSVTARQSGVSTEIGVVPDRIFGLQRKSNDTLWFFLEADRATMPIKRHGFKQSSFYRKLVAYHETWKQKILTDSFPRFQVLTVTTTPERVKNLIQTCGSLTQGKGLFLFVDKLGFESAESVLSLGLLNGRGETVTLIE